MYTGIIYISSATVTFDGDSLCELAEHAQKRNAELDVTGYLFFDDGQFIQYIEGPRKSTVDLMGRIEHDSRHEVRKVLTDHEVAQRRFPDWRMARVTVRSMISLELVLREHLALISSLPQQVGIEESSVWRMVQSLSESRSRVQLA